MVSGSILNLPVFIIILTIISKSTMLSNSCHGNHTRFFTNLSFSKTLKGISNTLQNLTFVELNIDEIVGGPDTLPLGIKCGSEIPWSKKG